MLQFFKRMLPGHPAPDTLRSRIDIDPALLSDIFVIGDIHGRLDLLDKAERLIARVPPSVPGKERLVITLGDYVDRGAHSRGVIDRLRLPGPDDTMRLSLAGNHDDVFLKVLDGSVSPQAWLDMGGDITLLSYGVDSRWFRKSDPRPEALANAARDAVPESHVDFLRNLPAMITIGDYVFVHAGIRPGIPLDEQSEEDLLWIRQPFLNEGPGLRDRIVIHGHTPDKDVVFGPQRICLDTGAWMHGHLPVLQLAPGRQHRILRP